MPPVIKNSLPQTLEAWLKVIVTVVSVAVTTGVAVWRVSALHSDAMAAIKSNSEGIASNAKGIEKINDQLRDVATHAELDREVARHAAFPHNGSVSAASVEALREDIKELKEELRRRMP